jgi:hypothetical protein
VFLSNDAFRKRTSRQLIARSGCSTDVAHLAAVALHPFSSRPASRAFEVAVRRASRSFSSTLRQARDEAEIFEVTRPVVEEFLREARSHRDEATVTMAYEWRVALEAATPVDLGAAEFAARADALIEALPPEQRGVDLHPDVDPDFKQHVADILAAAIARGEWRYTYSDNLIQGGAEPDLARMRRPHPIGWPIGYCCGQGHQLVALLVHERPTNSGIHHGHCDACGADVWAYAEWDEPVPASYTFSRLMPLSASPR